MKIWLAIPTMTPSLLRSAVEEATKRASSPIGLIVHYNGIETPDEDIEFLLELYAQEKVDCTLVSYSKENVGVPQALHRMWKNHIMEEQDGSTYASPDDFLLYTHDDVHLLESGWDRRLRDFLEEHPKAGLVGFGGARGLGDPDLYQKPYALPQLARRDFVSNMRDAEAHGRRITAPQRVSVLDGFSLGCRRSFLDTIGGFSWTPDWMVHHIYDTGLGCMAARAGVETWVLPLLCHHHGGLTATRPGYLDGIAKDMGGAGGDGEIHRRGHEWLYQSCRDVLPLMVES